MVSICCMKLDTLHDTDYSLKMVDELQELLVDRAVHAAASRFLSSKASIVEIPSLAPAVSSASPEEQITLMEETPESQSVLTSKKNNKFEILEEDFTAALEDFVPVAMRGIGKSGNQLSHLGWEDVGGLDSTRAALQEVELRELT